MALHEEADIATKEDLSSCRALSDKGFLEVRENLNAYHTKMDNYMNRLLPATNGKREMRKPDDLIVETWEAILILRDAKKFFEILRRWKKTFIGIGIILLILFGKWQIADLIELVHKYFVK